MGNMTARARAAGLVVAYTALADGTDACDALDEVVVAAGSWAAARELIRACGYRRVPRRAEGHKFPAGALEAALGAPGTVLRRRFGTGAAWTPAAAAET